MRKVVSILALSMLACAATPDIEGRWMGKIESGGKNSPVTLTLSQTGQHLFGSLMLVNEDRVTTRRIDADLQGDEFRFQVKDLTDRTVSFRLKVLDEGLAGDVTADDAVFQVKFPKADWLAMSLFRRQDLESAPVLLRKTEPEYTPEARAAGLQGTVKLMVAIDENGTATEIRVAKSLGMGLDEKAVECVKEWRFAPAKGPDGKPRKTDATVEVTFHL